MKEKKPNLASRARNQVRGLSRFTLYLALIPLTISVLMSLAFHINDDFLNGEVKGPHPDIGAFAVDLMNIGFYLIAIVFILSVVAVIMSPFSKPKGIHLLVRLGALLLVVFSSCIDFCTIERVRSAPGRFHGQYASYIAKTLKRYSEEHEGKLPPLENWCDVLSEVHPNVSEYLRSFGVDKGLAINESLTGMYFTDIPKDVVLLFVSSPGKNPVGGQQSISVDSQNQKGLIVVFGDLHIEFVKASNVSDLRWRP